MKVIFICTVCKKVFVEVKAKNKKYCSDICKDIFEKTKEKLVYNKVCKRCNKEFTTHTKKTEYCSSLCFFKKGQTKKVCKNCNILFDSFEDRYDFCSSTCKRLFNKNFTSTPIKKEVETQLKNYKKHVNDWTKYDNHL